MNILGIGTIFSAGFGVDTLESALSTGGVPPATVQAQLIEGGAANVYQVDFDSVPDKSLLKKLRRADKLSRMSVVAAAAALDDFGKEKLEGKRVGVILSTAFGAHVTTFDFLDGILDFGEVNASPTAFSNSVHNAAASYVSSSLEIKGPTITVTRFRFSFPSALQLAKAWLEQERCDYLLVGAVEQYGDVLGHVSGRKLNYAGDGVIRPFTFKPACQVPGEGAVFFLLGRVEGTAAYCKVDSVSTCAEVRAGERVDLNIIHTDGMLPDETALLPFLDKSIPVAAYSPLFGSMMSGGAFNVAAAALMIKKRIVYAAPEQTNPYSLPVVAETASLPLSAVRCLDTNCHGDVAAIHLQPAG